MTVSRATTAFRTSAIVALGAFTVHQLRYLASPGAGAAEGHAYLETVFPLLLLLVASSLVGSLAAARTGEVSHKGPGWRFCTAALLGIFVLQESAEGSPLLAHGGWVVVPIAIVVGRIVCWLLSLVEAAERHFVRRRPSVWRAPESIGAPRTVARLALARDSLAFGLARRPPPRLGV